MVRDKFSLYQADKTDRVLQSMWYSPNAVITTRMDGGSIDLWFVETNDRSEPERLTARGVYAGNSYTRDIDPFTISQENETIVFPTGGKWSPSHDLYKLKLGNPPEPLLVSDNETRDPRFINQSGEIIFVTDNWGADDIAMTNIQGTKIQNLTCDSFYNTNPQPHPSKPLIAYMGNRLQDFLDDYQLFVIDVENNVKSIISGGPNSGNAHFPTWSENGKYLYYANDKDGHDNIYRWNSTSEEVEQLTEGSTEDYDPSPHPTESYIAYTQEKNSVTDVCLLDTDTGNSKLITDGEGRACRPRWNSEGDLTFIKSDYNTPSTLFVHEVGGCSAQILKTGTRAIKNAAQPAEDVTIISDDGTKINSLIYHPPDCIRNGAGLVYAHGGPTGVVRHEWNPWIQFFVNRGFTLIAPNFRGSNGYGRNHRQAIYGDWGGVPLEDVEAAANHLKTLNHIQSDCIGVWGQSYGGYMTVLALARSPEIFSAGVAFYGAYDREDYYNQHDDTTFEKSYWSAKSDHSKRLMLKQFGPLATKRDIYNDHSPISDIEAVTSPLQIHQGLEDEGIFPSQAEKLIDQLEKYNKVYEYYKYPNQGHGFHGDAFVTAFSRSASFFEKYLTTPPT